MELSIVRMYVDSVCIPASDSTIETDNNVIFLFGETSMLDVGPEVVQPS